MNKLIVIENLQKKYKQMVLNIDKLEIIKGKSYLLIGSNGSGKSTLIKILLGLIKQNSGKYNIYTNEIGYMPEKTILPDFISVYDFLSCICDVRKIDFDYKEKKIKEYLDLFNLDGKKKIKHLSKGMLQKVSLIQTIIHNPKLYIFDEPLNGLDLNSQKLFTNIIKKLIIHKKTIIIATHFEKHYQKICENKLYINEGIIHESTT